MTFLPVLHRENKIMKGYFKILKSQPSSKSLYEQEYDFKKNLYLFFRYYFLVTACQVLLYSRTFAVR